MPMHVSEPPPMEQSVHTTVARRHREIAARHESTRRETDSVAGALASGLAALRSLWASSPSPSLRTEHEIVVTWYAWILLSPPFPPRKFQININSVVLYMYVCIMPRLAFVQHRKQGIPPAAAAAKKKKNK
ncbi:uncharacterized protein K452DRAFT_79889 [Aplosporella prunicola CBS 121167]|uniref:Uncharacterized protein n=1 Tax=Aplosporella prunicola CBS 121167 TaxID=1176127 RepID=A0A6A6B491_9PEZI|nr:uncharacterized protein K452DRAFT_79889 [Aplosporella prunicola CBS 121167]KAF2139039.1 hypothetical protein K452DRAFT_79889 [Aplosporella prunicola CBS 121167]